VTGPRVGRPTREAGHGGRVASANYWPSALQTLVLRAALSTPEVALDAWRSLRPDLEVDRLDHGTQRLLPLLQRNLSSLGVTDPVLARCKSIYRYQWSRNQLLFRRGASALEALAAAGVPTLLLKGTALVARGYGDPGLRPMNDFDVAVPEAMGARAVAALESSGWSSRHHITPAFRRVKHAASFEDVAGFQCDLHWRILEESWEGGDADLWDASAAIEFQGGRTRVLSPADQLFHVCVHGARHASEPGIRWIADAVVLIRAGDLDWARVLDQAARRRFVLRVRATLEFLKMAMDAPVPDAVLADLRSRGDRWFERLERRILDREHRLLGELPRYWCLNLRACGGAGGPAALAFPGYLQDAWECARLRELPRGVLGRAWHRLRARRGA
jgi:hypothetical protein